MNGENVFVGGRVERGKDPEEVWREPSMDEMSKYPYRMSGEGSGEDAPFDEVLYQAIDLALDAEKKTVGGLDFQGSVLSEVFGRMSIDDDRTGILLALLATNEPVTAQRFLRVVAQYGFAEQVEEARLIKSELTRVGDVAVEGVGQDLPPVREAAVPPPPPVFEEAELEEAEPLMEDVLVEDVLVEDAEQAPSNGGESEP